MSLKGQCYIYAKVRRVACLFEFIICFSYVGCLHPEFNFNYLTGLKLTSVDMR